jgi:hypothetical protein
MHGDSVGGESLEIQGTWKMSSVLEICRVGFLATERFGAFFGAES